jgi:uncharacterized protein (DUF427 family)
MRRHPLSRGRIQHDADNQDHPITCAKEPGRVQVLFEGHSIATSDDVLVLREAGHDPVRYFPRDHVAMPFLRKTDKVTHCPYKGEASYYTIMRDRQIIENAIWSYENPLPGVSQIAGRLAFYPEHFDFQVGAQSASDTEAADHGHPEAANAPARGVDAARSFAPTGGSADRRRRRGGQTHRQRFRRQPGRALGRQCLHARRRGLGRRRHPRGRPRTVAKPYEGTGSI